MEKLITYLRSILYFGIMLIADTYYRLHLVPQADGTKKPTLSKVNRAQVYADKPKKEQRQKIKRFSGFALVPQNIDYQQNVDGYYNLYEPPAIVPEKGSWVTIRNFLAHIFGDKLLVALDYLHLLYVTPIQRLPIIVLVSEARETGKTTFLRLLQLLLGENMVVATNRMIRSRFNSAWAAKLVVSVDETLLNRKEDSEAFKAIATAEYVPFERKGCDSVMIPNINHLIFCSNNLYDPLYIDPQETRYFVVEVPAFAKKDPMAIEKMKEEVSAFGYYLAYEHQMAFSEAKSRLWFPPEAYETEALRRIKRASVPVTKVDVAEILLDLLDEHDLKEISLTCTDLQTLLQLRGFTGFRPSRIFKDWGLEPGENLTYDRYIYEGCIRTAPLRDKGRFVTFTRVKLEEVLDGR